MNCWALSVDLSELIWLPSLHDLSRVDELVKVSCWAPGVVALVAFQPNGDVAEWRCSRVAV